MSGMPASRTRKKCSVSKMGKTPKPNQGLEAMGQLHEEEEEGACDVLDVNLPSLPLLHLDDGKECLQQQQSFRVRFTPFFVPGGYEHVKLGQMIKPDRLAASERGRKPRYPIGQTGDNGGLTAFRNSRLPEQSKWTGKREDRN
ncbi:unnamed protein product [Tuber aestivum]|uniref:Uncharacterized protein n=1 Tax=Tuber aestivum TaxID=59557 RepID=A0A292Q5E4_9PEZI|nr:unnamed protein product [Tuber aestivum]